MKTKLTPEKRFNLRVYNSFKTVVYEKELGEKGGDWKLAGNSNNKVAGNYNNKLAGNSNNKTFVHEN